MPFHAHSVSEVFDTLAYGPAPESPAVAYAWLDDHGREFGHFIGNKVRCHLSPLPISYLFLLPLAHP